MRFGGRFDGQSRSSQIERSGIAENSDLSDISMVRLRATGQERRAHHPETRERLIKGAPSHRVLRPVTISA
jgi:hypothetical protein